MTESRSYMLGLALGLATPFLVLLAALLIAWAARRIGAVILYAKPKYLERRINLAAELVDARRAYRLGGRRFWIGVVVGRQWLHDDPARAALKDELMPVDPDDDAAGADSVLAKLASRPRRYTRAD